MPNQFRKKPVDHWDEVERRLLAGGASWERRYSGECLVGQQGRGKPLTEAEALAENAGEQLSACVGAGSERERTRRLIAQA